MKELSDWIWQKLKKKNCCEIRKKSTIQVLWYKVEMWQICIRFFSPFFLKHTNYSYVEGNEAFASFLCAFPFTPQGYYLI